MKKQMTQNIRLMYVINSFRASLLAIPILVPFFEEKGISIFQFTVLQAVFLIVVLLVEVPSGSLADSVGRKKVIIAGAIVRFLGMLLYIFANSLLLFFVVEILLGLAIAMFSGADDSLVHESYEAIGQESEYKKFKSKSIFYSGIFAIIATVIGGWLGSKDLYYPFYGQILIEVMIVISVFRLTEPPREVVTTARRSVKEKLMELLGHFKHALHENASLKWLIRYKAVLGTMTFAVVWLSQPAYEEAGVGLELFGWLWAGAHLVRALAAKSAILLESKVGGRIFMVAPFVIGPVAYLILGWKVAVATLPLLYVFNFIHGSALPTLSDRMNKLTDPSNRATIISVAGMVERLLYSAVVLLIGFMAKAYSLQSAMVFNGLLFGLSGLVLVTLMLRKKQL